MKIKHLLYALLATGAANVAMAAPLSTITFSGNVLANTCTVNVGGNASPTVVLPDVGTVNLAAAGEVAGATPFTVSISGCTTDDAVAVRFTATNPVNVGSGLLGLTGASTATNVAVQLLDGDTAATAMTFTGGVGTSRTVTTASNAASLPLTARYYATGAAGAGTVIATANYEVIYP